jgi:hypothetical protein
LRRRLLQCGGHLGGGAAGSICAARTLTTKSWSIDSAALSSISARAASSPARGSSLVASRAPFLLRMLAPIASNCFGAVVERAGGARGRHALTCSLFG